MNNTSDYFKKRNIHSEENTDSYFQAHTFRCFTVNDKNENLPERVYQINKNEKNDLKLLGLRFISKRPSFRDLVEKKQSLSKIHQKIETFSESKKNIKMNKLSFKGFLPISLDKKSNNKEIKNNENSINLNNSKENIRKTKGTKSQERKLFLTKINFNQKSNNYKMTKTYTNNFSNIINKNKINTNKIGISEIKEKVDFYEKEDDKILYKLLEKNTKKQNYLSNGKYKKRRKNKKREKTLRIENWNKFGNLNKLDDKNKDINSLSSLNSYFNSNSELSKRSNRFSYTQPNYINMKIFRAPNNTLEQKKIQETDNLAFHELNNIKVDYSSFNRISRGCNTNLDGNNYFQNTNNQKVNTESQGIKFNTISSFNKDNKTTAFSSKNSTYKDNFFINCIKSRRLRNNKDLEMFLKKSGSEKINQEILRITKQFTKRFLCNYKVQSTERELTQGLEDTYGKIKEKTKEVNDMKRKYEKILEELDKKINFNLDEFVKEFEKKNLNMTFEQYYSYLLMILQNYEKKIVKNTFKIIEEPKEILPELKYVNIKRKHKMFKKILEEYQNKRRQYVKYINNLLLEEKK